MLRKDVILHEVRRFKWLAQQCNSESEKAFYLGAAYALQQSIGYSTREQNRIELAYERDIPEQQEEPEIIWNLAVDGDPFPISEEKWAELHPKQQINGLINDSSAEKQSDSSRPKRHDRIYY